MSEIQNVLKSIQKKKIKGKTLFIMIDGFGGSGKSTLAKKIALNFDSAQVVSLDDFYSPELEAADHNRVIEQIIKPLKMGKNTSYQRYDWLDKSLKEWVELEPGGILILEGVSTLHSDFDNLYDISIWLDVSQEDAAKRGMNRDHKEYGINTKDKWEKIWMPQEKEYVLKVNPKKKANFILKGGF